jgi:hypothetical protein
LTQNGNAPDARTGTPSSGRLTQTLHLPQANPEPARSVPTASKGNDVPVIPNFKKKNNIDHGYGSKASISLLTKLREGKATHKYFEGFKNKRWQSILQSSRTSLSKMLPCSCQNLQTPD